MHRAIGTKESRVFVGTVLDKGRLQEKLLPATNASKALLNLPYREHSIFVMHVQRVMHSSSAQPHLLLTMRTMLSLRCVSAASLFYAVLQAVY